MAEAARTPADRHLGASHTPPYRFSSPAACLPPPGRFYSLNPHSAALLLSLGLTLAQLLRLNSLNPLQVRSG